MLKLVVVEAVAALVAAAALWRATLTAVCRGQDSCRHHADWQWITGDLGGGGGGDSFEAVVMGVTGMGRCPWLTFPELSWWRVSLLLMVVERRVAMSCPIQLVALSLSSLDPRWRLKLWSWGQWWPCCCPPELIGAPLSRQGRGQVSCRLREGGYRC